MIVPDSLWWDGELRTAVALDGRRVVPLAAIPAEADCRRLPGTVLPGLVDAHVHAALVDLGTVRAGGIAAIWDLGGPPAQLQALSVRAELPRMRYAGPFLIAPGGYPSDRSWVQAGSCREIHSGPDAADAVGAAQAAGATLIKVTAHAGGPMLPAKTMTALVEAAHAAGLPVVVHAEGSGTVAAACAAGADLLAHTPWTEVVDEALVRDCARRMTWISTLDIHGWGTPAPARATAIGNLRRFRELGGTVRYGTDLGNGPLPPGVNAREIRALQEAGMSPAEIIAAMTEDDQDELGWIPGGLDVDPARFADVLATARVLGPQVRPRE